MLQAPEFSTPLESKEPDTGILRLVPSAYVGEASQTLPAATIATESTMKVDVDTTSMWQGWVRLTFVKQAYSRPKGKFFSAFWSCRHAERIDPPQAAPDQQA